MYMHQYHWYRICPGHDVTCSLIMLSFSLWWMVCFLTNNVIHFKSLNFWANRTTERMLSLDYSIHFGCPDISECQSVTLGFQNMWRNFSFFCYKISWRLFSHCLYSMIFCSMVGIFKDDFNIYFNKNWFPDLFIYIV